MILFNNSKKKSKNLLHYYSRLL